MRLQNEIIRIMAIARGHILQGNWRQNARQRFESAARRFVAWLQMDWRGTKYVAYGAILAAITTLVTTIYYLGMPYIERDPDTPAYLGLAQQFVTHGPLVDAARLPGYPALIVGVFAVAGKGNLAALSVVQGALFVLAAVEIYALACLMVKRAWVGFLVALLVGANTQIISYVKPILSEGLSLFLTVSLALAVALAIQRMRGWTLWSVAICSLLLFLTRPEWMYLPLLLFPYLLYVAARRGMLRRMLPHALAALTLLYGAIGLYVYANAVENHYAGVTYIQNINLLGKVMQYHMQDEAPPQYADVTRIVERYTSQGDVDPWHVLHYPYAPIQRNYFARLGSYSVAVIVHHPLEYLGDSAQLAVSSVANEIPFRPVFANTPYTGVLVALGAIGATVIHALVVAPLCALVWWALLLARRRRASPQVEIICAVALLAFYGLALTTLGGYVYYGRLHTPFTPLSLVVVGASVATAVGAAAKRVAARRRYALRTVEAGAEESGPDASLFLNVNGRNA